MKKEFAERQHQNRMEDHNDMNLVEGNQAYRNQSDRQ
jgi:hypothetical protein